MPVFRFSLRRVVAGCAVAASVVAAPIACGRQAGVADSTRAAGATRATRVTPAAPVTRDDFGRALPSAGGAKRIVSINPATTELLFAIGAGSRIVGRSEYDLLPDSARLVPSVGPALRPNLEAILGTHPDLVVVYASSDNREAVDRLAHAGVAVVAFKIDSIEQFERDAIALGQLTGTAARASEIVDSIADTLARVRAATADLPRPTVFLPIWERPLIAIGGGSFLSELLDIAGARNIYADIAAPSATVTIEDVVRRNPDVILASAATAATIRGNAKWRAIPAVRAGRILVYDTTVIGRPSVRLGAAARSFAALLHPRVAR
ncbi:MAG: ABC transporter substrate-binding protein [Gemmatimonadaceae bacterium]